MLVGLAALLGRESDAARHLEDAIRLNDAHDCPVGRAHAQRQLARIVPRGPGL